MALNQNQQALADRMSDISELCYAASWMSGTEYRLWHFVTNPSDDGDWGLGGIPKEERQQLSELSRLADGWVFWPPAYGDETPPEFPDLTFVPLERWLGIYGRWLNDFMERQARRGNTPRSYLSYPELWSFYESSRRDRKT